MKRELALVLTAFFPASFACTPSKEKQTTIRLVDVFASARVEGGINDAVATVAPTEWRFKTSSHGSPRWTAERGVSRLFVRQDRLAGRSETDFPILRVERSDGLTIQTSFIT